MQAGARCPANTDKKGTAHLWNNPKLTALTAERDALRKEYLADMRASFKQQLEATYVQTADGAKIPYAEYAKLNRK